MRHEIVFENCDNRWDNALPLGNGNFGAMMYYESGRLNMVMNHYEIYYNIGKDVLPRDKFANTPPVPVPGQRKERFLEQAERNLPPEGEPFCIYNFKRQNTFDKNITDITKFTSSYPQTGSITFNFDTSVPETKLILSPEDAKVYFSLREDERALSMEALVLRKDLIINRINQSDTALTDSLEISFPIRRESDCTQITYTELDTQTFAYTAKRL
ncbi:MAG: hypothetical protein IJ454_02550, partial [Clostridia bacterium]|nr:hypothetical protein [Clostridia bacterium]